MRFDSTMRPQKYGKGSGNALLLVEWGHRREVVVLVGT